MKPESFNYPFDGRGYRRVFVGGNEIHNVKWCDTDLGIVVFVPSPARPKKGNRGEFYSRKLKGKVEVRFE